jgi:hypothetical protein
MVFSWTCDEIGNQRETSVRGEKIQDGCDGEYTFIEPKQILLHDPDKRQ